MKKIFLYCFFLISTYTVNSQNVYISEVNYLGSTDFANCGEEGQPQCMGLELTGTTGTDLTDWEIKIFDCNTIVHKVLFRLTTDLDSGTGGQYSSIWYEAAQLNGDNSDSGGRIELLDPDGNVVDNLTYGPCEMPGVPNIGSQLSSTCSIQAINVAGTPLWLQGVFAPSPGLFNGMNESDLTACSNNVLAVELLDFSAIATTSGVVLRWETANEENNSHFIIERSIDGQEFESIGEVASQGKSGMYQYQDLKATEGVNYYRLTQVDFSGQQVETQVLSVEIANVVALSVFPNPVGEELNVSLPAYNTATVIEIYDAMGNLVKHQMVAVQTLLTNLDVETLPSGNYILRLVNGDEVHTQRFIKK